MCQRKVYGQHSKSGCGGVADNTPAGPIPLVASLHCSVLRRSHHAGLMPRVGSSREDVLFMSPGQRPVTLATSLIVCNARDVSAGISADHDITRIMKWCKRKTHLNRGMSLKASLCLEELAGFQKCRVGVVKAFLDGLQRLAFRHSAFQPLESRPRMNEEPPHSDA